MDKTFPASTTPDTITSVPDTTPTIPAPPPRDTMCKFCGKEEKSCDSKKLTELETALVNCVATNE